MRTLWIGLGLLVLVSAAEAATFTVTTTDEEDAAIGALLAQENQERASPRARGNQRRAAPLTPDEFRDHLIAQTLDQLTTRGKAAQEAQLKAAAEQAPAEVKATIRNLLTCGQEVC